MYNIKETQTSFQSLWRDKHAQVAFGLVVVERHCKVLYKKADCGLVLLKAVHKCQDLPAFFAPLLLPGPWLWDRGLFIGCFDGPIVHPAEFTLVIAAQLHVTAFSPPVPFQGGGS